MKLNYLFNCFITAIGFSSILAQPITDSIELNPNYTEQVFYQLFDGSKVSGNNTEWDIQGFTSLFASSFRINGGNGVALYDPVNSDTADFTTSTLDTTGMVLLHDSNSRWQDDAFQSTATGHPNYGWGEYKGLGLLIGVKTFAIKLSSGVVKKIIIRRMDPSGPMTFEIADLDGSNYQQIIVDRVDYETKYHYYLDIENDTVYDVEALKNEWDIVFRKYEEEIAPGVYYPVVGGLLNYGVSVAQVNNVDVMDAQTTWTSYTFEQTLNTIGHDWKTFNNQTFSWELEDSLSYFVQDVNEDIYQLVFTSFEGSSTGKFHLWKQQVGTASIDETTEEVQVTIYPNPTTDNLNITFNQNNQTGVNVSIYSTNGQLVKSYTKQAVKGLQNLQIDVNGWNKGMYILNITSDNQLISTKTFIKQ